MKVSKGIFDLQEDYIMNKKSFTKAGVAALASAVLLAGCSKINPDATLITINPGDGTKDTITLGYGNFAARYQQAFTDQMLLGYYGEDMWQSDQFSQAGSTLEQETKGTIIDNIEECYLAKSHANDYDIKLSDDQKKAIKKAAKKFMSDNSKETIEVLGATEEYVEKYLEDRTYLILVSDAAKKVADKDITEEQCWNRTFSYVLFDTTGKTDESGAVVEYTDDEIAEFKKQAEELSKSKDFDGDVEKLEKTAQKFSYLKGEKEDQSMDMGIINAAEKLSEGEVSSVIEVEGVGFYVIRLDSDHDKDASQREREKLQQDAFNELMDTWKEAVVFKVDDKQWEKVKFDTLFKAVEKPEDKKDETSEESTEDTQEVDTEESTEDTTEEESAEDNTDSAEDSDSESEAE